MKNLEKGYIHYKSHDFVMLHVPIVNSVVEKMVNVASVLRVCQTYQIFNVPQYMNRAKAKNEKGRMMSQPHAS